MLNVVLLSVVRLNVVTPLSRVLLFEGPDDAEVPLNIPKELAIKIFKTTLSEFKNRDKYIKDDYRFRDRFSKQNPRKVRVFF